MIYDIRLAITHEYQHPAGQSRHLVRVLPLSVPPRQRLTAQLIEVDPPPEERREWRDFYGNHVVSIAHNRPHHTMTIRLSCRLEVLAPDPFEDHSPDLATLRQELEAAQSLAPDAPTHFLGASPRLSYTPAIAAFAQEVSIAATTACDTVIRLGEALHAAIAFDATATTVDTDPAEAFAARRGVCQDLSHIMILGLRALGIPAAYVSGYLRTLPPEGGVRLEGADAMHAWVRAWCGARQGWIEYDPTNATLVGSDHIVVGYGRDYSDVSPVVGSLRASGDQVSSQSVDVVSAEPPPQ